MNFKSLIISIGLLSYALVASSQIRNISVSTIISDEQKKGTNESTRLVLGTQENKPSSSSKEKDYVLYRDIIRKNTWYEGVGTPITQEVANHLPFYYKLSMKNERGHWQHIEAMHQGAMTTNHDQSPYVLDKRNDNEEWTEKLKSVAQWFITSDLSGNEVVEERAYTKDGYLVYSFMPIKNADGRITGSYNDHLGLPADLREDETATYGSVVCITYDSFGRDSIIDFLDGQGLRKYNSNGVDQQRYQYDAKDRIVLVTSHNMVGDYATDNWGNCGNRYEYDDANNKYSITRVDKELKPIRMPPQRADSTRTFITSEIKKDEWGRDIEAVMLDEKGHPDQTSGGIHRITYTYDDKGNLQSTQYYDINGKPIK